MPMQNVNYTDGTLTNYVEQSMEEVIQPEKKKKKNFIAFFKVITELNQFIHYPWLELNEKDKKILDLLHLALLKLFIKHADSK